MTTTWESFIDEMKAERRRMDRAEGHAEGHTEGHTEGETEAMARMLLRQLEQRFGPLPEAIRADVAGASNSQLELWIDRVILSPDIDAIFE